MAPLIPSGCDALAGLEMGGIPIVTMLSQVTGLPTTFIRKKPKPYGTCQYAEGASLKGQSFVLIEDVVSTGGSSHTRRSSTNRNRGPSNEIDLLDCGLSRLTATTE